LKRSTWSQVAQTSGSRLYWLLGSLLTTVVTSRFLGPEGRGIYVAAVGWVMMFATVGHLSLAPVTLFVVAGKKPEEWLRSVLGSLLAIAGVVTLAGWAVAGGLYAATGGRAFHHLSATVVVLAFAALAPLLWVEIQYGPLLAAGRLALFNTSQIVGATASVVLTLVAVVVLRLGVAGALVALALAQLIAVAIPLAVLARSIGALHVDRAIVRALLKGAAQLHLNAVGTYLITQANVVILNHYRTPAETAHFQLALQLMIGIQIIPTAVNAVAYSLVSAKGPDGAWPEHRRLLFSVVMLVAALAVVGYFAAPFAVRLVFGEAYLPTVPIFRILLWGVVGMSMSLVMASQWNGRGLFLQYSVLMLCTGALTLAANWLVVPAYGAHGAAWVTVGTYGLAILSSTAMILWIEKRRTQSVDI
jgi:O-antigen/teichoic acid export membrane protein